MTYQIFYPYDHRQNLAEDLINIWKDHFIGVMSRKAESFPAQLWCQAIPQAEQQLLLLRQSNVNPKIPVYAYAYEPHDYIAASLSIPVFPKL